MRRPDLPLILIVVATGVALALSGGGDPPREAAPGIGPPPGSPDAVGDFFEDFDPVFIDCFGDVEPGEPVDSAAGDTQAVVEGVAEQVERLRKLGFDDAVSARFLAPGRLRGEVQAKAKKELPAAGLEKEEQVLKELGALPAGADLEEITTEMLGSQVAGLYDPKSGELLVQSAAGSGGAGEGEEAPPLGADELITLAHELDHALVDQAVGLRDRPGERDEVDRQLAYAALVEGDATLLMQLYALRHIRISDQLELGQSAPGQDAFAKLPDYIQRSLIFPYLEGLRFVCHRYTDGGWKAVDRAYERPPAATSQVITP